MRTNRALIIFGVLLTIPRLTSILFAMQVRKQAGLLLLAGAIVLVFVLAVGVNGISFLPGRPFSLSTVESGPPSPGGNQSLPGGEIAMAVARIMVILAAILFPISIVLGLLTAEGRRKLLAYAIMFVGLVIAFNLLQGTGQKPAPQELPQRTVVEEATPEAATLPPTDEFVSNTPDWLVIAVSMAIAVLLCGLVAFIVWVAWRRSHPPITPLQELAHEAQDALNTLQAGGELKDAVLRCYREMSRVLQQERGVRRAATMTAREFERALRDKGIPDEPVQQLTRLFEQARYGHARPGAQEEQQAIASLGAIVTACGAAQHAEHAGQAV